MRDRVGARLLREERGFTLPEALVTMMIMIVVLFALYSIFDMTIKIFSFGNDKVEATENARIGLETMEREIRAAYPVDRVNGLQHIFFAPGFPATPARPGPQTITFGNDLSSPNRKVDPGEEITYELRVSQNFNNACPTTGTGGVCTLVRRQGATGSFQPVVDYVVPNGLTFEYLRSNLTATDPAGDGTDIGVVRIELEVNKDGRRQVLTTDVDLRNRG
jgi:type II secretory pathway pseudopilin PulG